MGRETLSSRARVGYPAAPGHPEALRKEPMQFRYVGCLLAASLVAGCGGSSKDQTAAPPAGPPKLDVTARGYGVDVNGSLAPRPGPGALTPPNTGRQAPRVLPGQGKDRPAAPRRIRQLVQKPRHG